MISMTTLSKNIHKNIYFYYYYYNYYLFNVHLIWRCSKRLCQEQNNYECVTECSINF